MRLRRRISSQDLALPMSLRTEAQPLAATVCEVTVVSIDGEADELRVLFALGAGDYARVDREHLFHLAPGVRGSGADRFRAPAGVRIEARLDGDLLPSLEPPDSRSAADLLARAADGTAASPLASADAWYALSVTTPVELEEGVEEQGTLASGYTTAWQSRGGAAEESMLRVVKEVLEGEGWSYEELDTEPAVQWRLTTPAGSWTSFALVRASDDRLAVYSLLDVAVPEDRLTSAAGLVARINNGLPVGNWELDMDDGSLRYKTSIDVAGDRLSRALAENLVARNLAVVDACLPGLAAFADGSVTAEEALAMTET